MIIRYFLLFITCYLSFVEVSNGQDCSIIISSEIEFKISINRKNQHENFVKQLRINQLTANNKYYAELSFKGDSLTKKSTLFLLDDGLLHLYYANKDGLQLKKIVPEVTYTNTNSIKTITYLQGDYIPQDTTNIDTTVTDTTYKVPFASYYHLEDYEGKIGCPWPIKEEQFAELKTLILNESMEDSKLEKIKTAIMDIDSVCFLVDQVVEITKLFEYEETKLDFTKHISTYFFDIDNIGKLEEAFEFENSLVELRAFISKE